MSDPKDMTYEQYLREREKMLSKEKGEGGPPDSPPSFGERLSGFYGRLKRAWDSLPDQHPLDRAIEVGVKKAANEASNTVVGLGMEAVKHLGRFTSPEAARSFGEVYAKGVKEVNPLQFDVDEERAPGIYGFIEGAAQFGAGMAAFSKVSALSGLGHVAKAAVTGSLADLTVMDPHEERLSNLIENGPEWLSNPITRYLSSDEDDGFFESKFKQAAEGVLTGVVADGIIGGVKSLKAVRLAKAGKITAEEAESRIAAAATQTAEHDELVKVEHEPGGPSRLVVDRKKYEEMVGPEGAAGDDIADRLNAEVHGASANGDELVLEVSNPAQAESLGAALNSQYRTARAPREVTPVQLDEMKRISERISAGTRPEDAARMEEGTTLNFRWVKSPEDAKRALVSAAEAIHGEAKPFMQNASAKDGNVVPWEQTVKRARGIVAESSLSQFLTTMGQLAESAEKLPAYIDAARGALYGAGKEVARLSSLVNLDEENPILQDELLGAVQSLVHLHDVTVGTQSDVGRALNIMQREVKPTDLSRFGGKEATAGAEAGAKEVPPKGEGGGAEVPPKGEGGGAEVPPKGPDGNPVEPKGPEAPPVEPEGKKGGGKKGTTGKDESTVQLTTSGPRELGDLTSNANYVPKKGVGSKPLPDLTRSDLLALARQIEFADGDADRILKALRGTTIKVLDPEQMEKPGFWRKMNGLRANMMLSGPTTHETNIVNNAIMAAWMPGMHSLGGLLTGNVEQMRRGALMFAGNFAVAGDAAKMALKSLRENRAFLDPDHLTLDDAASGDAVRGFASFLSAPTRALMTADEFFKQMNYRSHVRAQSLISARKAATARGLDGKEAAAFIADRVGKDIEHAFDIRGGAVNVTGLMHSREATFTQGLETGIGAWLQDGANKHPLIRFIFPFVRTPVNIFRFNWQHMPVLGAFQRQMRQDFAAGGARRSLFYAKQAAGTMLYSMAGGMAAAGMLVGGGPKNPDIRQQWLAKGNRPYTLKIGGKQLDYRRIEPFGTALGIMADMVEMAGELKEDDADHLLTAGVASMMASVSSKTFLIGMSDFFDAMSSGEEWRVQKLFSSSVRSFTPNILNQLNPDDHWRESRSIVEEIAARTPGWSETLEPRRNLFGEPVARVPGDLQRVFNPFTVSDQPNDKVANALYDLGRAVPMPSDHTSGGLDLTDRKQWVNENPKRSGQSPYDRMLELLSKPEHGPSLREQMTKLVESDRWEAASAGTEAYPGGRRLEYVTEIAHRAQERARNSMLREYPELERAMMNERREKAASYRSGGLLEAVSK